MYVQNLELGRSWNSFSHIRYQSGRYYSHEEPGSEDRAIEARRLSRCQDSLNGLETLSSVSQKLVHARIGPRNTWLRKFA